MNFVDVFAFNLNTLLIVGGIVLWVATWRAIAPRQYADSLSQHPVRTHLKKVTIEAESMREPYRSWLIGFFVSTLEADIIEVVSASGRHIQFEVVAVIKREYSVALENHKRVVIIPTQIAHSKRIEYAGNIDKLVIKTVAEFLDDSMFNVKLWKALLS